MSSSSPSPALVRSYDKDRSDIAIQAAQAPRQRPGETAAQYQERLSRYLATSRAMDLLPTSPPK